ncbi:SdpI family protein [Ornithinimicrobium sp. INDO-MA30-4]|uniref:SdpI family protein n=1 Tax=Ornithinimicrobium sp. INDO-MA30-4 TaxID=2908651 RepID=UPI001F4901F6|nr:SdpI family protein [Ornithinimicrobium sp. INDO-MA30-4]UJH71463.1 SdpI family protein [Ornithinimicrobium sp. INDO-MA30-4]
MDTGGIVIAAVGLVIAGGLSFLITSQAGKGNIAVNSAIGIKTKITQSSQEAWEVAHRAALPWVKAAAIVCASAALFSVWVAARPESLDVSEGGVFAVLMIGYAGLLVLMGLGVRAAHQAVRSEIDPTL